MEAAWTAPRRKGRWRLGKHGGVSRSRLGSMEAKHGAPRVARRRSRLAALAAWSLHAAPRVTCNPRAGQVCVRGPLPCAAKSRPFSPRPASITVSQARRLHNMRVARRPAARQSRRAPRPSPNFRATAPQARAVRRTYHKHLRRASPALDRANRSARTIPTLFLTFVSGARRMRHMIRKTHSRPAVALCQRH